jgi:acetyl-CoA synthetase
MIEALLREDRTFAPPASFQAIGDKEVYKTASRDSRGFWVRAAEELHGVKKWDKVLDWRPPHAQWFVT